MLRVTCILFKDDLFPPPVEFNKAARSLTDAVIPTTQKKTALNRLVKASTHVNVHQDLKYVKLWQVHTLLKGLEKIAASADIRMLVCGDFNSVPGSAPHAFLAMGKVDPSHPD